jgi:hypothetical protein
MLAIIALVNFDRGIKQVMPGNQHIIAMINSIALLFLIGPRKLIVTDYYWY